MDGVRGSEAGGTRWGEGWHQPPAAFTQSHTLKPEKAQGRENKRDQSPQEQRSPQDSKAPNPSAASGSKGRGPGQGLRLFWKPPAGARSPARLQPPAPTPAHVLLITQGRRGGAAASCHVPPSQRSRPSDPALLGAVGSKWGPVGLREPPSPQGSPSLHVYRMHTQATPSKCCRSQDWLRELPEATEPQAAGREAGHNGEGLTSRKPSQIASLMAPGLRTGCRPISPSPPSQGSQVTPDKGQQAE